MHTFYPGSEVQKAFPQPLFSHSKGSLVVCCKSTSGLCVVILLAQVSGGRAVLLIAFEVQGKTDPRFPVLCSCLASVGREETSGGVPFVQLTAVEPVVFCWQLL